MSVGWDAALPAGCVLRPTLEEVESAGDFASYVASVELRPEILERGVLKIVAPEGWSPLGRKLDPEEEAAAYETVLGEVKVRNPIRQEVHGRNGAYSATYFSCNSLSVAAFRAKAEVYALRHAPPSCSSRTDNNNNNNNEEEQTLMGHSYVPSQEEADAVETRYWKRVRMRQPIYGADGLGSLFGEGVAFHLGEMKSLLNHPLVGADALPGVTDPYLYYGMFGASFAWHCEDMDLYAVNYIHGGAPKTWYCIPLAAKARMESLMATLFPEDRAVCKEFLRHKACVVAPALLDRAGIPYTRVLHCAREFVVTLPAVYHAGFNHGYNIAESVNFANDPWLPHSLLAKPCTCVPDSVVIDVALLLSARQAERKRKRAKGLHALSTTSHMVEEFLSGGEENPRQQAVELIPAAVATVLATYVEEEEQEEKHLVPRAWREPGELEQGIRTVCSGFVPALLAGTEEDVALQAQALSPSLVGLGLAIASSIEQSAKRSGKRKRP